MSHQEHNLELFRGLIKFKNITKKIWGESSKWYFWIYSR